MPPIQWYDRCVVALPEITDRHMMRERYEAISLGHNEVVLTFVTAGNRNRLTRAWTLLTLNEDLTLSETPFEVPPPLLKSESAMTVCERCLVVYNYWERANLYVFDLETRVWEAIVPSTDVAPPKRLSTTLITLSGRLLLIGGNDLCDVWTFDFGARRWIALKYNIERPLCFCEKPMIFDHSCYLVGSRDGTKNNYGFRLSDFHGRDLTYTNEESVISTSSGLLRYYHAETHIGVGYRRVILNALIGSLGGFPDAQVYDVVACQISRAESIPVRCGGWGKGVTAAMLNPTTAVVVGYRDVVVVDIGSHLQVSEFFSD
ncbi:hypothetical protein KIPB_003431 [Kipferlia bialata]|uniref:Uncharacterized protein n=1 Tax=Kipferlia bialata TaxID=797122 RepID=A0A391NJZ6_9EUKA|nr:hypothetical protein KIPB_003431 [Kipferlia bialata]|eukprot:g3431.t1